MKEDKSTIAIITDTSADSMRMFTDAEPVIIDPMELPPILDGPNGKAWLCNVAKLRKLYGVKDDADACICHWVVEAPWAHPIWHSYSVVCIHLRPLVGVADPIIHKEGATHEIWVYACNPSVKRLPIICGEEMIKQFWLTPKNFAAQFIEDSDETAVERVKGTVQMICDGKLSPDTDFIHDWGRLFGFNMIKDEYK
jgi:hypothetical protein